MAGSAPPRQPARRRRGPDEEAGSDPFATPAPLFASVVAASLHLVRPPLALDRLTESTGGQLLYHFRRAWSDGSTALLLAWAGS